ncbi:hypothetical protein QJS10_CPA02g00166 [Acorus calamus]|uniref:Uncharacterized protein n=1 Tax=Acorus calamus TaxID=4465 RepID=A0AAV9FB29_ACOCL|nr:hypothetical protein QJS10_CPA02g00166 [Acorus calamus]
MRPFRQIQVWEIPGGERLLRLRPLHVGLVVLDVKHRLRVRRRHHHRMFQRRDLATVLRREGYRVAVLRPYSNM